MSDTSYDFDYESGASASERTITPDINMAATNVDPTLAESAGVAAASGDSTNPGFTYISRPIDQKIHTQVYKNSIMAETWGYAYKVLTKVDSVYNELMTPLACIPAHQLALYMSPAEFEALPSGSMAVEARIKVTPKGFRTSFATQQTNSTYSNSNHTIFGVPAVGLNTSLFGKNIEIAGRDATKPMLVNKTKACKGDSFRNINWGKPVKSGTDEANFIEELPMCIGVHRSLPYYWNSHIYTSNGNDNNDIHLGTGRHWYKKSR